MIYFHAHLNVSFQAGESTINLKGMIIGNGEVSFKQDVSLRICFIATRFAILVRNLSPEGIKIWTNHLKNGKKHNNKNKIQDAHNALVQLHARHCRKGVRLIYFKIFF